VLFPEWGVNALIIIAGLTVALLVIAQVIRSLVSVRTANLTRLNMQLQTEATERQRAETLLSGQNQVLEMIATGLSLQQSLTTLIKIIEELSPPMLGSILLLDEDGLHMRLGASPSLPAEFSAAVDGLAIGPCAGSCGTAAYRKEAVYVTDIETDPLWANYKSLALAHGLHACWFTPIFDAQQRVLGTFAMYYREPGFPQPQHLSLIDSITHTATILINNYYAEQALRTSEQRLQLVIDGLGQKIFVGLLDTIGTVLMANQPALKTAGLELADVVGKPMQDTYWWNHSDTVRERVCAALERAAQGESVRYDEQIRVDDDQLIWIDFNIQPLRDDTGTINFLVPSGIDITERKQAERAVRESETKLRTIIESSPVAMAITDEHENITFLNRKFLETFGYTHADIPCLDTWWPLAYPDPVYRQQVIQTWRTAAEKAHRAHTDLEPLEYKVTCRKGAVLDIRFSMAPIGNSSLVILYDLTPLKQAE
jgi:PAS domain S-box-containing protein